MKTLVFTQNIQNIIMPKMKDRKCNVPVKGPVWLKSKMYTYLHNRGQSKILKKSIYKNFVIDKLK